MNIKLGISNLSITPITNKINYETRQPSNRRINFLKNNPISVKPNEPRNNTTSSQINIQQGCFNIIKIVN